MEKPKKRSSKEKAKVNDLPISRSKSKGVKGGAGRVVKASPMDPLINTAGSR
jgi:hypothetical protein